MREISPSLSISRHRQKLRLGYSKPPRLVLGQANKPTRPTNVAKTFPHFPDGLYGAGILVIRIAGASAMMIGAICPGLPLWMQLVAAVLALLLLIGVMTRPSAALSSALVLLALRWLPHAPWPFLCVQALHIAALCFIGGGAYSIDGVLFGLRVIRLPR